MAKTPKLKVYRTPIGFHDAYVAAASQKAALAAWGSDVNLFARGVAEEVTGAELMRAPLAAPGTIVKRLREADDDDAQPASRASTPSTEAAQPKKIKTRPRPSRDAVDAAEHAIADAERQYHAEQKALAERQAALDRERHALDQRAEAELAKLCVSHDKAAAAYEKALAKWRG